MARRVSHGNCYEREALSGSAHVRPVAGFMKLRLGVKFSAPNPPNMSTTINSTANSMVDIYLPVKTAPRHLYPANAHGMSLPFPFWWSFFHKFYFSWLSTILILPNTVPGAGSRVIWWSSLAYTAFYYENAPLKITPSEFDSRRFHCWIESCEYLVF